MHFCRPVILCAYWLLSFSAGFSHSFQFLLPSCRACHFMCRPITLLTDLSLNIPAVQLPSVQFFVPSLQACYLLCRPVILCAGLLATSLSLRTLVYLLPYVQTCLPSVQACLPSVQSCYPPCRPAGGSGCE